MDYDIALCEGGNCPQRISCYRAQLPLVNRVDVFGAPPFVPDGGCDYFWPYTRVRIGMQANIASPLVYTLFQTAIAQGLDGFEFCCDECVYCGSETPGDNLPASVWPDIRAKADTSDVELSVRSAFGNVLLPGQIDRHSDYAIQLAHAIGATMMVVPMDLENGSTCFIQRLSPMIQELQHFSCRLALENTPSDSPDAINALFESFWNDFPQWHSLVGLCFDMGHANLCDDTRNDYHLFLDKLNVEIPLMHLHLHENWGDADNHLPLFSGSNGQDTEGLKGVIYRLGKRPFAGSAILCHRPEDAAMAGEVRTRLAQMLYYNEHMWTTASGLRQGKR